VPLKPNDHARQAESGSQAPSERAVRHRFFETAAALTPYLAVETDTGLFFVATSDRGIGMKMFVHRTRRDISCLATAMRLLRGLGIDCAGSTFVEVGANIGTTSVTALRRHGFAGAVALEPVRQNFALLRLNLVANGLEKDVAALELAATSPRRADGTEPVTATTLDALVARGVINPREVGLLWIDAPKQDQRVLAGASTLLAANVPVVVAARARTKKWPERSAALCLLLADYTHFADLRREGQFRSDFPKLAASLTGRTTDILAVRGGAAASGSPSPAVRFVSETPAYGRFEERRFEPARRLQPRGPSRPSPQAASARLRRNASTRAATGRGPNRRR
jgi:hypothetical protein